MVSWLTEVYTACLGCDKAFVAASQYLPKDNEISSSTILLPHDKSFNQLKWIHVTSNDFTFCLAKLGLLRMVKIWSVSFLYLFENH